MVAVENPARVFFCAPNTYVQVILPWQYKLLQSELVHIVQKGASAKV